MTKPQALHAIILAAGKGTRMKSAQPKVMHTIAGLPMLLHIVRTCKDLGAETITTVIAPDMESVAHALSPHTTAVQQQQLGSGDAVKAALPALANKSGLALILVGDAPLITAQTLKKLTDAANLTGLSVLGMIPENPTGYGRLVCNDAGYVTHIVEEKDASTSERAITLCNAGMYAVSLAHLHRLLNEIDNKNNQQEYYLTDLVAIAAAQNIACAVVLAEANEVAGVNNRAQLAALETTYQNLKRKAVMDAGATLIDPNTVYFSYDTVIGQDVTIEPNVFFGTGVVIGNNVTIHAFSHLEGVTIEDGAAIGPFARIRPHSYIGAGAVVGNFVEVNRSTLNAAAKSKHMSYLGDATIGPKANIGAGTVIANYDGINKHKTDIGAGAFIGSNSTLVAPLTIGQGAFIGAGSTITKNVTPDSLAVARADTRSLEGWATKHRNRAKQKDKT